MANHYPTRVSSRTSYGYRGTRAGSTAALRGRRSASPIDPEVRSIVAQGYFSPRASRRLQMSGCDRLQAPRTCQDRCHCHAACGAGDRLGVAPAQSVARPTRA